MAEFSKVISLSIYTMGVTEVIYRRVPHEQFSKLILLAGEASPQYASGLPQSLGTTVKSIILEPLMMDQYLIHLVAAIRLSSLLAPARCTVCKKKPSSPINLLNYSHGHSFAYGGARLAKC